MKIAISSSGPDLESKVDPRFGRCQYFLILDLDDMSCKPVSNANIAAGSGAGIQSAKVVADKGAEVVLTGRVGPNAYQVLSAAGLTIITGVSGQVRKAVQQYKNGQLQPAEQPNAANHSGLQPDSNQEQGPWLQTTPQAGFGMGRGAGGGRGMGRGCGIGGGRCRTGGRGMGMVGGMKGGVNGMPPMPPVTPPSKKEELTCLRKDARMLREQMEEIENRIKELEKEES